MQFETIAKVCFTPELAGINLLNSAYGSLTSEESSIRVALCQAGKNSVRRLFQLYVFHKSHFANLAERKSIFCYLRF